MHRLGTVQQFGRPHLALALAHHAWHGDIWDKDTGHQISNVQVSGNAN